VIVEYSDVQGDSVWPGPGNMNNNPRFADPWFENYRLHACSPLIDEGKNEELPCDEYPEIHDFTQLNGWPDPSGCMEFFNDQKIPIDLDWEKRVVQFATAEIVDMGAYEVQEGEPVCDPGQCPGDLNQDGVVDGVDLLALMAQWGPCSNPCECPADLNCDGEVDGADLLILLSNWGGFCTTGVHEIPPETIEDCYERYEEDTNEFLACVFAVEELQSMQGGD